MNKILLILLPLLALLPVGCSTKAPVAPIDLNQLYKAMQDQKRSTPVATYRTGGRWERNPNWNGTTNVNEYAWMPGTTNDVINIELRGNALIELAAPVEPIKALPQTGQGQAAIIAGIERLAKFGIGVWGADRIIENLAASRDPLVVQPQVERVPEPVFIPAAP